ncbi:hypothetical protein EON64_17925, partial [archaeon]
MIGKTYTMYGDPWSPHSSNKTSSSHATARRPFSAADTGEDVGEEDEEEGDGAEGSDSEQSTSTHITTRTSTHTTAIGTSTVITDPSPPPGVGLVPRCLHELFANLQAKYPTHPDCYQISKCHINICITSPP